MISNINAVLSTNNKLTCVSRPRRLFLDLEVADSFKLAVRTNGWTEVGEAIEKSNILLNETHQSTISILQYNNENFLACAIAIAYYTARSDYQIMRELPAGKGFADLVFSA